ncbi:hypothetical protein scyTo_0024577, partial [Scyliorhinus torazame]|nr:hypothetical protein [Scyliorhinus torazame]
DCDALYHRHPSRGGHQRVTLPTGERRPTPSRGAVGHLPGMKALSAGCSWPGLPCTATPYPVEQEDTARMAARPGLGRRSLSADHPSGWQSMPRPDRRPSDLAAALGQPRSIWTCASCGLLNEARAVLCGACDRPRASPAPLPAAGETRLSGSLRECWSCQACTFRNDPSAVLCSACERPRLAGKPSFTPGTVTDSILEHTLPPMPKMSEQVMS